MTTPKSTALSSYKAKSAEAERCLAKVFVAFVRTRRGGKLRTFIVYSSDGDLVTWRNDYFQAFLTTAGGRQNKELTTVIDGIRQSIRKIYADNVVHSTVVMNVLSPYVRLVLENLHEPLPLMVCGVFVDCVQKFDTLDYRGATDREDIDKGPSVVRIIGCYDNKARRLVISAIRSHLIGRPPTKDNQRMLTKVLKRITHHKHVGCVPLK